MKRRTEHEAALASCGSANPGVDIGDRVHRHFTDLADSFADYLDVADEGRRLWNVMLDDDIERWSPEDSLISGVAAAAYHLAISEVATRLGVSPLALLCAIESQEEPGMDGFLAECKKCGTPEERNDE